MNSGLRFMLSMLTALAAGCWPGRGDCSPPANETPEFSARVRVLRINGRSPAATQHFQLTLSAGAGPIAFDGTGWSSWASATRDGIARILKAYPNAYNSLWQVKADCMIQAVPALQSVPRLEIEVETAIANGEKSKSEADLFGPSVGLLLWKDGYKQLHIDTLAGHGRRVYDVAMRAAQLAPEDRPQKIIFGDRYIGGDDDSVSWKEGIQRLAGLGFNALHPVPANLTSTVREAGIHRIWGAVYNPPGYAFNFKPDRQADFTKFVQEQIGPLLAAGWKPEEIAFWITSDEPGWYYPAQYDAFNKDPDALSAFHAYLKQQGLSLRALGKPNWTEVRLIGRKQITDLPSRRLFYWSNRFAPWASARFFAEVARTYEAATRPGFPVLVNFNNFLGLAYETGPIANNAAKTDPNAAMGQHDWLEFGRERGTTSISTEDWFGDESASQWSFYGAKMRSAAGLSDVGIGGLVIPRVGGQTPGGMAQKLLALIGQGAKNVDFFVFGPEYNFPGNCYSENPAVFKPLADGMRIVHRAEDLLYAGRPHGAKVAILTPQSAPLWDLEDQQIASGLMDATNNNLFEQHTRYMAEQYGLYRALQHSAIPVQFVDERKLTEPDFREIRVLYLTAPDLPIESTAALLRWVRDGGTLVTVAGSGEFDRYHQPDARLQQALGIQAQTPLRPISAWNSPPNGSIGVGNLHLPVFGEREGMTLAGAKATVMFADGTPAAAERKLGKGRILRVACYPGYCYARCRSYPAESPERKVSTAWRDLIVGPVRDAKAALAVLVDTPEIEAPALYSSEGIAVTLLNWSGAAQTCRVAVGTEKPVRGVSSSLRGNLAFRRSNDGMITVTLPLGDVDVLMLHY